MVLIYPAAVHTVCLQTPGHCCCRFAHGFDAYMKYAFPHDELRPLSKTWTDSLGVGAVLQLACCLCHLCLPRHSIASMLALLLC